MSITEEKKTELVSKYGEGDADTGSAEVQIAIMSERIKNLTEHLREHRKDFATRRGLLKLIGRRRRLQNYLQNRDPEKYAQLIKDLELRR
ncbi:MAG: 30S ribosomal protein S15 [Candidatus Latescibacterota bacterium]|nr:30S ribosomal protein S15 [Candidatus Latescibacterota bacterium]